MAIKVNGTTVIDDSRNLVNIASGAGSSTTFGAVGTYVLGAYQDSVSAGSTYAGSSIYPSAQVRAGSLSADSRETSEMVRSGTALSGTWRAMGYQNAGYWTQTVFVRIS